jgi:hypothetical protein
MRLLQTKKTKGRWYSLHWVFVLLLQIHFLFLGPFLCEVIHNPRVSHDMNHRLSLQVFTSPFIGNMARYIYKISICMEAIQLLLTKWSLDICFGGCVPRDGIASQA